MITASILILISAIAKALQDHCKINSFPESWTWWNERTSWKNKYVVYHIVLSSLEVWEKKPRFFGSTTFLVWLTDGWHFFQMVYLNTLMVGFILLGEEQLIWYWYLVPIVGFKVLFEAFYRFIKHIT